MGDQKRSGGVLSSPDQVLQGLVRELKNPLLFIARQAEFSADSTEGPSFSVIEQSAQEALQLIDSYLLTAQSEYGQKQLSLEPIGLGSILYEVAHQLDPLAKKKNYRIEVETKYTKPVMVDRRAAEAALSCLAQLMLVPHGERRGKVVRLSSFRRSSEQIIAGVLTVGSSGFKDKDLRRAVALQGRSHMAVNSEGTGSGVQLALADSLANAMGGQVLAIKHARMKGLGLELLKSEQLALV